MVEWIATTVPGWAPATMPSSPSTTSRTSTSSRTMTDTRPACSATARGVETTRAPAVVSGAVAAARASHTTSPPGQSTRCPAMGAPMCPRPTKPTAGWSRAGAGSRGSPTGAAIEVTLVTLTRAG